MQSIATQQCAAKQSFAFERRLYDACYKHLLTRVNPDTGECLDATTSARLSAVMQHADYVNSVRDKDSLRMTSSYVAELIGESEKVAEGCMRLLRRLDLLPYKKVYTSYFYGRPAQRDLLSGAFYSLDDDIVCSHGLLKAAIKTCYDWHDSRSCREVAKLLNLHHSYVAKTIHLVGEMKSAPSAANITLVGAVPVETPNLPTPTVEENIVHLPTPKKERTRKHWSDSIDAGIGNIVQTNAEKRGARAAKALSGSHKLCNVKALLTQQFPDHGLALSTTQFGMFIPRWKELGLPSSELVPWLRFTVENWDMLHHKHNVKRDVKGRQKSEVWGEHPNLKNMGFSIKHINRYYKEHKEAAQKNKVTTYRAPGGRPMTTAEYGAWFRQFKSERYAKGVE